MNMVLHVMMKVLSRN